MPPKWIPNLNRSPDDREDITDPTYKAERGPCACGHEQALYADGKFQGCPIDGKECGPIKD